MLRRLRAFLVLSVISIPAAAVAQEAAEEAPEETSGTPTEKATPADLDSAHAGPAPAPVTPNPAMTAPPAPPSTTQVKSEAAIEGWRIEIHGYFRAPMALGISSRPNTDEMGRLDPVTNEPVPDGPPHTQLSYAPNRVLDWSYYSFAYTRLQEQDWAELTFHAKKKHVDAAIGWMGYWLAASGYRNPDAAALPGVAYLRLDTDFDLAGITPNIALTMGSWWPAYGYFEKYDTYTLGRFRHMGELLRLTVPVTPDLTITLDQGFGTGRDGKFGYTIANTTPLYAGVTGANLVAWGNARVALQKYLDVGLHYNYEWTRDPNMSERGEQAKSYTDASKAYLSVAGAEAAVTLPYAGRLWISPSYLRVKNGWALSGQGGTEVMHAQGGYGIAANYMQYSGDPASSPGTGSMINLGFLYENSLSNVLGTAPGVLPDVRLSIFALLADVTIELPSGSPIKMNKFKQLKYGADVTLQALPWLALMLRGDTVNYNIDAPGYIFSAITGRLIVFSNYLSGESIYLQFSRYIYGNRMVLAGKWRVEDGGSGWPLVAGTDVLQGGKYASAKPDENVIKLQAQVVF